MPITKSDLHYKDYDWIASADNDTPKNISDTDVSELNQKEGYEMLYFINSLALTWRWQKDTSMASYQHLEKIIRMEVPYNVTTYSDIMGWIASNYQGI